MNTNIIIKIFGILCIFGFSAGIIHHYVFVDATTEQGFSATQSISHQEYHFQLFDVETIRHPSIESQYPTRAQPDATQSIVDLQHRVNILPFEQDKDRNGYVVYPKHGIVTPLSTPSLEDTTKINNGEMFNHYPYLDNGALHYRGNDPTQGNGNMVIAAHSSYIKDAPGRYKTVFQALPISQKGDNIFVYLKNENDLFDLYTYVITDSFRTQMTDVSVLHQTRDKKMLTTYGCYIIGDNSERWVNQAILESHIQDIALPTALTKKEILKEIEDASESAKEEKSHSAPIATNTPTPVPIASTIQAKEHSAADALDIMYTIQQSEIASITQAIPAQLLPQLQELVLLIIDRLQIQPELHTRVISRLITKIQALEGIPSTAETEKLLSIYKFIYYYLQLL